MKKKPSRPVIIQNISCINKKNVKYDENQINLLFLWKTDVEASKVITNSLEKIFWDINPFYSLDTQNVIFDLQLTNEIR